MARVGLLLLAATSSCLIALLPLSVAQSQCSGSLSADGDQYTLSWATSGNSTTFTVSATTTGWVAVGFSADDQMADTDVVIGANDGSSQSFIEDRYASARTQPSIDASQDTSDASATFSDGTTTLEFTRTMDTGDSSDDISLDQPRYLLWAWGGSVTYGSPNVVGIHSMTSRGVFPMQVDFSACASTPVEFEFSKYIGAEGATVSVCIRPMYALEIMNVVVTMTAVSGTADETDYAFMPADLTLSSGFECADVDLRSDSMSEDVESFYITLSSNSPYIDISDNPQVEVSIYDEDSCPIDPEGSICKDILFLKLCQYIEEQSSPLPLPCLTVREKYSNIMHTA